MKTDLERCPFCASSAEIKGRKTVMVSCTECSASTFQLLDDKESSIRQWNNREPQWIPIAKAPKDGSEILGFSPGVGSPLLIRWSAPQDFMTTGECEQYLCGATIEEIDAAELWLETPAWTAADFLKGGQLPSDCQPSHWMPLPSAPGVGK